LPQKTHLHVFTVSLIYTVYTAYTYSGKSFSLFHSCGWDSSIPTNC